MPKGMQTVKIKTDVGRMAMAFQIEIGLPSHKEIRNIENRVIMVWLWINLVKNQQKFQGKKNLIKKNFHLHATSKKYRHIFHPDLW